MLIKASLVVLSLVAGGCESHDRDAVEPNDLGITEIEIRHDRIQDDRFLTVRGLDQAGEPVATAVLRTGMVMYGADMPEQLHAGTELKVAVNDTNASFISPDRIPHVIYEPLSPSVGTFVRLHAVASEIDREAGIRFAPPSQAPSDEIAFTTAACSGSRFPINKGSNNRCCQDGPNTYHVNPSTLAIANRSTYAPVYPSTPVCRDSNGNIGCTTGCMYGPCGSAVISTKGTNGHVFVPTSNPNVCGWDDGGAGGLGVDYSPEHYASQTLWGGMTPTCSCTGCNADGTAQCGFFDDFNRTTGLGANWNVTAGSWTTDGAYAVSGTSGDNHALGQASPALGTADYSVSTKIKSPASNADMGVFARYDKNNPTVHYYAATMDPDDNFVTLARRDGGLWTYLWQTDTHTGVNLDHDLKLVVTGQNPVRLQVWFEGQLQIQYDDTSIDRITVAGQGGLVAEASGIKYNQASLDPASPIAAPPGLPVVDDFNRTGTTLGNWIVEQGFITTDGSYAVANSIVSDGWGYWAIPVVTRGTEDYSVQADVQIPQNGAAAGVFARATGDGTNTTASPGESYSATLSTIGLTLFQRHNYTVTTLATYSTTITPGIDYTVKLVVTGSNPVHLVVYLNGTQRISYDDSSAGKHTNGAGGICTRQNSTGTKWNSFRLDSAGSCTPTTCAAQGKNCDTISDGCGGTLNCGTCTAPQTCGGGGTANVCGGGGGSGLSATNDVYSGGWGTFKVIGNSTIANQWTVTITSGTLTCDLSGGVPSGFVGSSPAGGGCKFVTTTTPSNNYIFDGYSFNGTPGARTFTFTSP